MYSRLVLRLHCMGIIGNGDKPHSDTAGHALKTLQEAETGEQSIPLLRWKQNSPRDMPNSAVEDYFAFQPLFTCELQHMAHRE